MWFRMVFFCCPHIWAGAIVAAAFSNFALLAAAFHLGGSDGGSAAAALLGGGGPTAAFALLGGCVVVAALGFGLVWANMVPRFRPTLWRRRTLQMHCELGQWPRPPYTDWGGRREDARALLLNVWATRYWPRKALVQAWAREHWSTWKNPATRPHWFDAAWLALWPLGWLPEDGDDARPQEGAGGAAAPPPPGPQPPVGGGSAAAVRVGVAGIALPQS